MFTIIDRYMLRQFMQVLIICFFSLIGLYIVIDAFGHLDHFVDYAEDHGSLLGTLVAFYAYRSIEFFNRTAGVLTLVAVMFTVTWIQRHHEMTALLAAGVTRMRVLRPVLIAAIGVSLVAAANREVVMPTIRHQLSLDSKNLGGQQEALMQARFDSNDILIGGEKIVPAEQKIKDAKFVLPRQLDRFGKQLSAAEARFLPANGETPSGYLLSGVTQPKALLKQPSILALDSTPVIITPPGNDWLKSDQVFVVSSLSFEFLAAGATWRDFASTPEMIRELRNPSTDLGADVRVAIHSRFLQPFLDTTLIFLGLPFVVTRTNRNPFIAIGLCLAVVTVFMGFVLGCQSLGAGGWLNPPLAAWMPLIVFAPIAAGMSESLRQ